jgi:hypothetical protein
MATWAVKAISDTRVQHRRTSRAVSKRNEPALGYTKHADSILLEPRVTVEPSQPGDASFAGNQSHKTCKHTSPLGCERHK